MKKNYSFKLFKCLVVAVVACFASALYAQTPKWEKIHDFPGTNDFFITKSGNMLMADLLFDWNTYATIGGIYISKDKGETWTKTGAKDYCYNYFIENDEYIFAAAGACRVARSNDGGETWEMLSYQNQVVDVLGEENLEYALAYSMAIYEDKLFVGDFTGGGIVYSADNGETWVATDVETLKFDPEEEGGKTKELQADKKDTRVVENIYNMMVYNGDLYAFGTYCVFKYLPETNSWETLDISAMADGRLQFSHATGAFKEAWNLAFNLDYTKELQLEMAFSYVDADWGGLNNDVKVGIWVNGQLVGNRYFYLIDYVSRMGTSIIYVDDANNLQLFENGEKKLMDEVCNAIAKQLRKPIEQVTAQTKLKEDFVCCKIFSFHLNNKNSFWYERCFYGYKKHFRNN